MLGERWVCEKFERPRFPLLYRTAVITKTLFPTHADTMKKDLSENSWHNHFSAMEEAEEEERRMAMASPQERAAEDAYYAELAAEDEWAELAAVIDAARTAWAAQAAQAVEEEEKEEALAFDFLSPAEDYEEPVEEEYRDAEFFQWVPEKESSLLNPLAPAFKPAGSL